MILFCHECGAPTYGEPLKFCGECGSALAVPGTEALSSTEKHQGDVLAAEVVNRPFEVAGASDSERVTAHTIAGIKGIPQDSPLESAAGKPTKGEFWGTEDECSEGDYGPLDREKTRLLYLISLYTRDDYQLSRKDTWVRTLPILVLIYEGIITGAFDYDYAPQAERVAGKRININISQEGRDDIDDLREGGYVHALKLTSENYQCSIAVRATEKAYSFLKQYLDIDSKTKIEELVLPQQSSYSTRYENLLKVKWDSQNGKFLVFADKGYSRESTITDIEAVSYVSSPYIPKHLKTKGTLLSSNADRVHEIGKAADNIKDELNENITLDDVRLLVCEWVPMGGNQIVALNDKLGSSERVQGGFFTANIDENPDGTLFQSESEGLTAVNLLDFDETRYVNFEAEVFFESEEGIVQIENFGVHFSEEGLISYGLHIDAIMDRIREHMSLDQLSRLLVDVIEDSSKVVANLLSAHQRALLDLTFLGDAENRDKFNVIFAEAVSPKMFADQYMDKEDNENEIKQVIGDTYYGSDLSNSELLIVGKCGILITGAHSARHEPMALSYASFMARNIFMKSVFNRCFILADVLKKTRNIIDTYESNPDNLNIIREMLSVCTEEVIMLSEIQTFLAESCEIDVVPDALPNDIASNQLAVNLKLKRTAIMLRRRAVDMEKTIIGCSNELEALREMSNTIGSTVLLRTREGLEANTKNLEDAFRAQARGAASLEVMQVVLAGSLAFDIVDRTLGQYLSIADRIGWVVNYLQEPLVETPLIWFAINMIVWLVMGGGLIVFMRHLAYMGNAVEAKRIRLNRKLDLKQLHEYLQTKPISATDVEEEERTLLKKYSWDESGEKWEGQPPKVELTIDERYHFMLQAFFILNKRRCRLNAEQVWEHLRSEMQQAQVFPPGHEQW
eukprot:CAMPEP_0183819664 /NCGR_PEP_ID=MMETSP0803_2-20130417/64255_1 /TAXON_ID=195967 /ORGANISM="Crustomastix stigmata, Strain CCMP3273" /LENGTH=906 /DNA_ID=CAMNT_0026064553 /DNA_START=199 /DNA_END=2916 /DNA_ORIENTATION=-